MMSFVLELAEPWQMIDLNWPTDSRHSIFFRPICEDRKLLDLVFVA